MIYMRIIYVTNINIVILFYILYCVIYIVYKIIYTILYYILQEIPNQHIKSIRHDR